MLSVIKLLMMMERVTQSSSTGDMLRAAPNGKSSTVSSSNSRSFFFK